MAAKPKVYRFLKDWENWRAGDEFTIEPPRHRKDEIEIAFFKAYVEQFPNNSLICTCEGSE